MGISTEILTVLAELKFLADYPILVSFIGGLLAGEIVILTLSFLSAQGLFPLWTILFFFWLGEVVADTFYFEIGRSRLFDKLMKFERFNKSFNKADKIISEISRESLFLTILYSKLVYGSRTVAVLFLGAKKSDRKKFIFFDATIMFFIVLSLGLIGWFAGKGYSLVLDNFKSLQIGITFVIVTIFVFIFLRKRFDKFLILKRKTVIKKFEGKSKGFR